MKNKKSERKKLASQLLALLFITGSASAEIPFKDWVYRVDTRPYSDIFTNGFNTLGDNTNIGEHAKGTTCLQGSADSQFISTSTDNSYTNIYARRLLSQRDPNTPSQPIYVYIIRPTRFFFNMANSLRYSSTHGHPSHANSIPTAQSQSEWITDRRIDGSMIYGVRIYRDISGQSSFIPNPNYISETQEVNSGPYIPTRDTDEDSNERWYVSNNPRVTACFSATLNCFKSQREVTTCHFFERFFNQNAIIFSSLD